ncbi:hypothetical protein [Bradyrhizobium brasilense]|uniref:hypothetical protein n=1 Tax=Bradyrhizobium brasilense TaxID=1419277 RepID=UPI001E5F605C|nr:hypothetical protein [Bradyrhizobium brasilense]MCC8968949.1 hypothetical protein [Bradyrhizobium brasilense]
MTIPGMVNQVIGCLLATSVLAVIGIADILNAAKAASSDPNWLRFYKEAFLLVIVIYFAIGYGSARYGLWQRLARAGLH